MINLMGMKLEEEGFRVVHSDGDADLLIVQTAVQAERTQDTVVVVVVGEDTGLLVLLCHHANLESHKIFFRPELKKAAKKTKVWNIHNLKKRPR